MYYHWQGVGIRAEDTTAAPRDVVLMRALQGRRCKVHGAQQLALGAHAFTGEPSNLSHTGRRLCLLAVLRKPVGCDRVLSKVSLDHASPEHGTLQQSLRQSLSGASKAMTQVVAKRGGEGTAPAFQIQILRRPNGGPSDHVAVRIYPEQLEGAERLEALRKLRARFAVAASPLNPSLRGLTPRTMILAHDDHNVWAKVDMGEQEQGTTTLQAFVSLAGGGRTHRNAAR